MKRVVHTPIGASIHEVFLKTKHVLHTTRWFGGPLRVVRVLERAAPDGAEEVGVELLRFLQSKEELAAVGREGVCLVLKAAAGVLKLDDVPRTV